MSQTNTARYKYNPNEMSEDEFLKRFVVRQEVFDEIYEALQGADYSVPNQHHILVGQRGQGKTTILRKLKLEVQKDKKLSKFLIPVQFTEEQYNIRTLCRLWEKVAEHLEYYEEALFEGILEQVESHEEDDNYGMKCFSYLEKELKSKKKKLLLLIDNIDILLGKLKEQEQHQLREILLTSSSFIIVGGSTRMFEQQYEYSKPFYEFFNILILEGLNFDESIALLKILGDKEQTKKIEEIIENNPARIETLRRITGGVPRTMVMLFDIFIEENGNAFNDLLKVLDDVTPLYKDRMDHLSPVLQDIVDVIALNWDGMLTKEIAKKTKLESKVVSAQLKQLEKYQIVDSVSIGKNKIYSVKERFFNIWYLMRFGKKKDRQRVEWLIQFLLSWYSQDELEKKATRFRAELICGNNIDENYVYYFTEALIYSGALDHMTEDRTKRFAKEYLSKINSSLINDFSETTSEIMKTIATMGQNKDKTSMIKLIENNAKDRKSFYLWLGLISISEKKYEESDKYYMKYFSNIKNIEDRMFEIGFLYDSQQQNKKAKEYYIRAIEGGNALALHNLIWIYFEEGTNRVKATELVKKEYEDNLMVDTMYQYATLLLWEEDFSLSYEKFNEWLSSLPLLEDYANQVIAYLSLLIAKGQLYKAKEFLEMPECQLKERYKPIWYALMTLMQDVFPHEIKKMGSELKGTVDEVLEEIERLRVKYTITS